MRIVLAIVLAVAAVACGTWSGGLFRQYEYEEEMYLSLDGSAMLYVNSSVPALAALRGSALDPAPAARLDRGSVAAFFASPVTRVTRVTTSRRNNRQFVHVRIEVDDVGRLGEAAPFAWSSYQLRPEGNLIVFQQAIGPAAASAAPAGPARNSLEPLRGAHAPSNSGGGGVPAATRNEGPPRATEPGFGAEPRVKWTGQELVAFRVHIPSKVVYHNAGRDNLKRGNILVWEQTLTERLRGTPLMLDARMETQSILYRTLLLFGATFVAVATAFGLAIWVIFRRGARADLADGTGELRS